MFGYTIVKKKELDQYKRVFAKYNYFSSIACWFSKWTFLDPLFDCFRGTKTVNCARDEFEEAFTRNLYYRTSELRDMEAELTRLRDRVKYFEYLIKDNHKENK